MPPKLPAWPRPTSRRPSARRFVGSLTKRPRRPESPCEGCRQSARIRPVLLGQGFSHPAFSARSSSRFKPVWRIPATCSPRSGKQIGKTEPRRSDRRLVARSAGARGRRRRLYIVGGPCNLRPLRVWLRQCDPRGPCGERQHRRGFRGSSTPCTRAQTPSADRRFREVVAERVSVVMLVLILTRWGGNRHLRVGRSNEHRPPSAMTGSSNLCYH
jgi:hypothetical protein